APAPSSATDALPEPTDTPTEAAVTMASIDFDDDAATSTLPVTVASTLSMMASVVAAISLRATDALTVPATDTPLLLPAATLRPADTALALMMPESVALTSRPAPAETVSMSGSRTESSVIAALLVIVRSLVVTATFALTPTAEP